MAATGISPPPSIDPIQAIAEFKDAILEAGLVLRGDPVMDGKIHRVPVQGARSKGNQSGRYVGYLDEHPAGKIWNYKEGVEMGWRASRPTRPLSEPQRKQREERIKREQAARETERLQTEERVAQWARRTWQRATPVESHPYLSQKGVAAHNLRVDHQNRLLIPMCDLAGNLCSLQSILEDGQKHFTRGGRQIGTHHVVGSPQSHRPLLFAEGYATAASIHQATGLPVVVCFNSGNLLPVVQDFRHQYPDRQLIIAADNDHHLTAKSKPNVGIEKAMKAAQAVSAHAVLVPPFPSNSNETDWNDYHAQHGLEAVRNLIYQQMGMTKEINMSETTQVQEYESTTKQVKSQAENSSQPSSWEQETKRPPMTELEAKVLEAYQRNTPENWRDMRSVGFGAANVDQIWKTGGEPDLQIKEGGIYRLVLDNSGSKGYVVPDPNLEMRANYVRSEGFEFLFQGYEPTSNASTRLQLLQAAAVERQGDHWVVTGKGKVQSRTLEQQTEREPASNLLLSRQAEQAAKEKAIELANLLPGGSSQNQLLLSRHYDELRASRPDLDGATAWALAAEKLAHPRQAVDRGESESPSERAIDSATTAKAYLSRENQTAAPPQSSSLWEKSAELLDHGAAPYQFDKNNELSYFVKLREQDGTEMFRWGKELPAALEKAGAQAGDLVVVERTGQVPVVVPVPVKDAAGNIIRTEALDTHRNEWQIDVVKRPEHAVADRAEANSRAATIPYAGDRSAPWGPAKEDHPFISHQERPAQEITPAEVQNNPGSQEQPVAPSQPEQEFWNRRGESSEERQARYNRESHSSQERSPASERPTLERPEKPALERLTRAQVEQALAAGTDLQDKDLSGLDLSNLTFRHTNLSGSSLAKVTARNLVIEDCFALGTDFTEAQFDNSTIRNLNASGSCWNRSELHATSIESGIFDSAVMHDMLVSGESRPHQQGKEDRKRAPSVMSKLRPVLGELLESMARPPSLREDIQNLMSTAKRGWNALTRLGQATQPGAGSVERQVPAVPIEMAHNSFAKADLSGARFVGIQIHHNNFDGAILRGVIGLAHAVDVTKHLEHDSKRGQELANLREEGLERLGCKDQDVNREVAMKLTEALDRKLAESLEKSPDRTPRQILDNAVRSVLNENAVPTVKSQENERERTPTRARNSR